MPYFNAAKAKQAGYSDQEIADYVKKNNLQIEGSTQAPAAQTPVAEAPQGATGNQIIDGLLGIGKALVVPTANAFVNTGKRTAEAANQLGRVATDKAYRDLLFGKQISPEDALRISKEPVGKFMSDEQLSSQGRILSDTTKDAATVGSLAIPGGKGLMQVLGRGALSGGAYGYGTSEQGKEAGSTIGGALGGAAGAGVGYGLGKVLGRFMPKGVDKVTNRPDHQKAIETAYNSGDLNKVSKLIGDIPDGDPYKSAMQSLFGATDDLAAKQPYEKASAGVQTYLSNFTIPTKRAGRLKPQETAKAMIKYGLTGDLDEIGNKAASVSGSDGILSKLSRKIIGNTKEDIPLDTAMSSVQGSLDKIAELTPSEEQRIMSAVRRMLPTGKRPDTANALDVFDSVKELEKLGHQYLGHSTYLTGNIKSEQIGNVYLEVAENLKDVLGKTVKDSNSVKNAITPEVINSVKNISPELAKDLSKVTSLSELRSLQAPFVRVQNMVDLTNEAASSSFQNLAGSLKGVGRLVPSVADPLAPLKPILGSAKVNTNIGAFMDKTGGAFKGTKQAILGTGGSNPTLDALSPIIGRSVGSSMTTQGGSAEVQQTDIIDAAAPQELAPSNGGSAPKITTEMLQEARLVLSDSGFKKLKDIYDLQQTGGGNKTEAQVARSDAKDLVKKAYSSLLDNPGLDVGIVSSRKQSLLGNLGLANQDSLDFLTTIGNLKASIAKARAGTAFTPNEEKLLDKYTPNDKDSKQQLETKLRLLLEILNKQ